MSDEQDIRPEIQIAVLRDLNETIDQAAARARNCEDLAPKLAKALALAWYLSEEALRDAGQGSCGHVEIDRKCPCCKHFDGVRLSTQMLRRHI